MCELVEFSGDHLTHPDVSLCMCSMYCDYSLPYPVPYQYETRLQRLSFYVGKYSLTMLSDLNKL